MMNGTRTSIGKRSIPPERRPDELAGAIDRNHARDESAALVAALIGDNRQSGQYPHPLGPTTNEPQDQKLRKAAGERN